MNCSRRSALRCLGAMTGLAATGGCLGLGVSSGHTLVAHEITSPSFGSTFLVSDPVAVEADTRIDFATETKQQYLADLFENGIVTVHQWPLVARDEWGQETRPRSTFIQREGTYYEVQVTDQRLVERERWLFALERTDSTPPDDARVISQPFNSLSEQDRGIVQAALDAIHAGADGFLGDPEFDDLQAVQYHQDLSVDESELVPSPPFDFVEAESERFRVITDQRVVSIPEWTFSLEPIADSQSEFETYAVETVPDARLDEVDFSDGARQVLDTAVGTDGRYEEEGSVSDGLSEVLDKLGIGADLQPLDSYEDQAAFRGVIASYDDAWYRFDLLITP